MKLLVVLAVVAFVYEARAGNYLGNYGDLLSELSYLYDIEKNIPMDKYSETDFYPDTESFDSRSNDDWDMAYPELAPKDTRDYGETALRDPEYVKQLPISGYQFISGGTGREQADPDVKTDKVLPAYCTPPNPCPYGYKGGDNCVEHFENNPENNRRLLEQQDCPCDAEHMLNCPPGGKTIDPKSGYVDSNPLSNIDLSENPFLSTETKREQLVAKKTPHFIKKRETPLQQMGKEFGNPYLFGDKMSIAAKKAPLMQRGGL